MVRNLRVGIVVALAAVFSFALTGVVSASESSRSSIHVIEHADTDTIAGGTDRAGAILTFHNPVFDKANKKQVGSDRGDCTRIDTAAGTWECRWTTFLAGGQLTVEGPFNDTSNTVLSITGGTGVYSQARGQMQLLSRNGGAEYDFIFELTSSRGGNGS